MLRIDLSGLSRAELRRLLAAAEARGQAGPAETLRAELAGRAAGKGAAPLTPVVFDDEPDRMLAPDDTPPLAFELTARRAPPPRRWSAGLVVVAMLVAGGATAWGLTGTPGWPRLEYRVAPVPRAMTVRTVAGPAPAQAAATSAPELPAPESSIAEAPASPPPAPPRLASVAPTAEPEHRPRRTDPCAAPPTPADRLLCNDLALNLLERELRDAYGRALSAGADPVAVRESQAAWRRARDPTSDPQSLARLYDSRIRDLQAMAGGPPRPDAAAETPVRPSN